MNEPQRNKRNARWKEAIASILRGIRQMYGKLPQIGNMDPPALQSMSFGSLPHPNGGWVLCGAEPAMKIMSIVEDYLSETNGGRQIEAYTVYNAFMKEISVRFLGKNQRISVTQIQQALDQAVVVAEKERKTITHWIPCHLVANDEPASISIGPITFQRTSELMHNRQRNFEKYIEDFALSQAQNRLSDDDIDVAKIKKEGQDLVEAAQRYYGHFDWVAQVTISEFAPRLSLQRARLCVQAALDIFRLRLGRSYGRCIDAEGRGMSAIDGVQITEMPNSKLDISLSRPLTVIRLTEESWSQFVSALAQARPNSIGKLLETLTNGDSPPPLCQRLLDALNWFGQAVTEESPGAAIMKFVTSIERITQCNKKDKDGSVTKQFRDRATALHTYHDHSKFDDWKGKFNKLYDLRSKITHGSISPLDPTVGMEIEQAEQLTKRVITGAFGFFEKLDAYSMEWNPKNLDLEMNKLVENARRTTPGRAQKVQYS